jgi:hypothetical protein
VKLESLILLILASLLAPAACLVAYGARREHWPHIATGAAILGALALAGRFLT